MSEDPYDAGMKVRREVLLHTAVYAGVPAANAAYAIAQRVLARTTGLSRAAARRFLLTLEQLGYVRQSAGGFALTPRILELGYAFLSSLSLPEVAQPHRAFPPTPRR